MDSNIYLIGMYPSIEITEGNKRLVEQSFRALSLTYGCSTEVTSNPKQQMNLSNTIRIAVEEKTKFTTPIQDFEHPEKAAYYVGNSQYPYPSYWCEPDYRVHIDVPGIKHPLYGYQALAIILNDRYMKNGSNL